MTLWESLFVIWGGGGGRGRLMVDKFLNVSGRTNIEIKVSEKFQERKMFLKYSKTIQITYCNKETYSRRLGPFTSL